MTADNTILFTELQNVIEAATQLPMRFGEAATPLSMRFRLAQLTYVDGA